MALVFCGHWPPVAHDAIVALSSSWAGLPGGAGFVESLLRLIGPDRDVSGLSSQSRRHSTLAVNIPHRAAQGPLRLSIDGTGIKVGDEGEWNARKCHDALSRLAHQSRQSGTVPGNAVGLHRPSAPPFNGARGVVQVGQRPIVCAGSKRKSIRT